MIGFAPQVISNIVSGRKSKPSFDVLNSIISSFVDIDSEWLLTGQGNVLKNDKIIQPINRNRKTTDKLIENQEIPLYDFEATAGLKELFSSASPQVVLDTIKIPNIPKCDGAVSVTGDSMYPLLKSGDLILYKEIPTDYTNLFFGEMYLIGVRIDEWEEYITVKYIQKSNKGDEYVTLVSQNQHHQPKDIKFNQITALAMVKASIRYNTMF
ncbi:MAG: helix-turn-helix transcriptional regulator [Tenacibaculum sp.]|nr:helix-turn-helix transcriptional regulator [Tenacibaculum sp.]